MQTGGVGEQGRRCHRVLASFHLFFRDEESIPISASDSKKCRQRARHRVV
jgi:hypothetical protein